MIFLSSCSTKISNYPKTAEAFDIKQYFDGNIVAWGILQDYSQQVKRRFCVEILGTWQENKGVLAEKFYFDDGEITYRNWDLVKQFDGTYKGTAEDVANAAIGVHQGFAFQFQYELLLSLDGDTYLVTMDDWMYQIDEHRVMNKTSMSKFGVQVAEITIFFDKQNQKQSCL